MGLAQLQNHHRDLTCPRCSSAVAFEDGGVVRCTLPACRYHRDGFPVVEGAPALIDFERSIVPIAHVVGSAGAGLIPREPPSSRIKRRLVGFVYPQNHRAKENVARMLDLLRARKVPDRALVVLVVGGGAVGSGIEELYATEDVDVLGFDVYWSPNTQFIADAHQIPLADHTVDAVLVQAVLEHVLEPAVVVGEIHRVLRQGGLVYADTPFLQPVHEGPYDFTRFTESGHRYLFRDFDRIDSGVVAGAGTELAWSIDMFFRSLLRSPTAGALARLAFWWLPRLDRFLDPRHSLDAASSVFLLGRKADTSLAPRDIVPYYQGAQYRDAQ